jgi:hypothetical protein
MARILGIALLVLAASSAAFATNGGNTTNGGVSVPEPTLMALLLTGGAYGLARARRNRQ